MIRWRAGSRRAAAAAAAAVVLSLSAWFAISEDGGEERSAAVNEWLADHGGPAEKSMGDAPPGLFGPGVPIRQEPPPETAFSVAAESGNLRLSVDDRSGHFRLEDKSGGYVWRSYPAPDDWDAEASEQRRRAVLSPLHIRYVEPLVRKDQTTEANLLAEGGEVRVEPISGGFAATYVLPSRELFMTVRVTLRDDGVDISLRDAEWRDTPRTRLASAKVYPYFGASSSVRKEGYLFIPDGPGALIDFKADRPQTTASYNAPIYGEDLAFGNHKPPSNRSPIALPVFGAKSGDAAFLAVVMEGAEYAGIFAAPSGSYNVYNWTTAEHVFRQRYFQPTSRDGAEGYFVHNEERFRTNRTVRYFVLTGAKANYSGMAAAYRVHLMETAQLARLAPNRGVQLHLKLLGGDREPGFLFDAYVPVTTTEQAKRIVSQLHSLGVEDISVRYSGWQSEGYSRFGPTFPVASGLGGDAGMRSFVSFARALGASVFLEADAYAYNNAARSGFRPSRDGMRDLGSSSVAARLSATGPPVQLVSPKVMLESARGDLAKAAELGVDGFVFGGAAAAELHSDYNRRQSATRTEARAIQEKLLRETKEALGDVRATGGNVYALADASHVYDMADDYSYDLFVDKVVPFAQMSLHGLIPYSLGDMNARDDYRRQFLRSVEYGAEPTFAVGFEQAQRLLDTYGYGEYYSTNYEDWLVEMVEAYQIAVQALGGVRESFIVHHETLAPGVNKTEYENGTSVIVNYAGTAFRLGTLEIPPLDFAVVAGGGPHE